MLKIIIKDKEHPYSFDIHKYTSVPEIKELINIEEFSYKVIDKYHKICNYETLFTDLILCTIIEVVKCDEK